MVVKCTPQKSPGGFVAVMWQSHDLFDLWLHYNLGLEVYHHQIIHLTVSATFLKRATEGDLQYQQCFMIQDTSHHVLWHLKLVSSHSPQTQTHWYVFYKYFRSNIHSHNVHQCECSFTQRTKAMLRGKISYFREANFFTLLS